MYFECDIRHLVELHGEKQKPFLSLVFVITVTLNAFRSSCLCTCVIIVLHVLGIDAVPSMSTASFWRRILGSSI